ncbi:MAG: hypothetical protein SVN78_02140 [Deferribacterota bacterium]|nr:hypothetical protein [Deferribacterota bacterium]
MEIKFNPYINIINNENIKGNIFDNKKSINIKGKLIDVKDYNNKSLILIETDIEAKKLTHLIGDYVKITNR